MEADKKLLSVKNEMQALGNAAAAHVHQAKLCLYMNCCSARGPVRFSL